MAMCFIAFLCPQHAHVPTVPSVIGAIILLNGDAYVSGKCYKPKHGTTTAAYKLEACTGLKQLTHSLNY